MKAVPIQVIEIEGGVILKRGALETRIAGDRAAEVIQIVLSQMATGGATREKIREVFAAVDRAAVDELIDRLIERGILMPADREPDAAWEDEGPLDVFYWNFAQKAQEITARLNQCSIAILGVNRISRQLALALTSTGWESVEVVDYPLLRNLCFFRTDGSLDPEQWALKLPRDYEDWGNTLEPAMVGCLVATSDFGGLYWMRQWNELCVANQFHFLPVVLQNLIGYVGPLVVPGETACYECLRARQNAHLDDPAVQRAAEAAAFEGQSIVGYHPSMASVLGDIAAFELTKFYGGGLPLRRVGTLIELNLLEPRVSTHKVLKVPRCPVCSPLKGRAAPAATKTTFLPGNRIER